MKVSGNEIEISFRKAALGAEIPLGLAEDFGRIGYWLAARRVNPLPAGLAALDAFDAENSGAGALLESEQEWNLTPKAGQGLSALYAGASACDLLCVQYSALRLRQVDAPLLVLVAAALAAAEHALVLQVELLAADGTTVVACCDSGMVCAQAAVLQRFTAAAALDMRLQRASSEHSSNKPVALPAAPPDDIFSEGADVDEAEWSRVQQYATRMLVPASETSRAGAGAGELDSGT